MTTVEKKKKEWHKVWTQIEQDDWELIEKDVEARGMKLSEYVRLCLREHLLNHCTLDEEDCYRLRYKTQGLI